MIDYKALLDKILKLAQLCEIYDIIKQAKDHKDRYEPEGGRCIDFTDEEIQYLEEDRARQIAK